MANKESVLSKSTTNCTPIEILPFGQDDKANVREYINSNLVMLKLNILISKTHKLK
ncbi:hypothetical protein [Reichenbachiella sp. MALMAid0571]|uniref:hypothetical protein n=1 Tax=Reichenbachiella sp. MALMAid0571 TaxID=3143939 RepID=UPI0032DFFF64